MTFSDEMDRVSSALNRVMFGSGIKDAPEFNSQFHTLAFGYVANLIVISILCALVASALGSFDLKSPLYDPLSMPLLGLSNLITWALMCSASRSWDLHPTVVEQQRKANPSRAELLFFVAFAGLTSALLAGAAFFYIEALWGSVLANPFFFLTVMGERQVMRDQRSSE